jgi:aspartyl protease family protein
MVRTFLLTVFLLVASVVTAEPFVQVVGLFKGKAVLQIDSRQVVLGIGQTSPEGITLVEADSKSAVIEVNGQRKLLHLSRQINAGFEKPNVRQVKINKNKNSQYRVAGSINGRRQVFLVDTGANVLALSSESAARLGINFQRDGRKSRVVSRSRRN